MIVVVASTIKNANVALIFQFLHRVIEVRKFSVVKTFCGILRKEIE